MRIKEAFATAAAVDRPPTRIPIFLSALVYPGVGQLAQHRWVAATLVILSFTVTSAFFLFYSCIMIMTYYRMAFSDGPPSMNVGIALIKIGVSFVLMMACFLIGVLDTWFAYRRSYRQWSERQVQPPPALDG